VKIEGIIWLESILEKLAVKHGVKMHEVEQVLENHPQIRFVEKGNKIDEDVYMALGQTDGGRYLAVLFIHKVNQEALIVSTRDMAAKERKLYGKK
jgi:uncharacterized protein